MFELLLSPQRLAMEEDDHDLPFPAGTPFKGVVRSVDFINGPTLASRIDLTAGTPINNDSGWLHFVEDNGYNVYIAKKPLRAGLSWSQIDSAQQGKEIIIGGKTFLIDFITGMKTPGIAATAANAGGQWNRYMYNLYAGEFASALPATRENWGSYTEHMLGIPFVSEGIAVKGSFNYVKETVSNDGGAHACRGMYYPQNAGSPNVMGVWYGAPSNSELNYGWRPLLYEKGTTPPVPITPFKGEVAQASFITLPDLQTATGYSGGSALNPNTPWMMIVENGKTYYFPKAPFVSTMTREQLNAAGVVDGSKIITIAGKQYKVRLMTGRDTSANSTSGGEWLHWMTNLTDGTWASYVTADLGGPYPMTGGMTHVYDKHGDGNWALSGYPGFLGAWYQPVGSAADPAYGWRPVLELIEPPPPTVDTWENQGVMPMQRSRWAGVEINGLAYLYGGYNESTVIQGTLHAFDPAAKTFTAKTSGQPRSFHDAVAIGGKMYVFGGLDSGAAYTNTVQCYDPVANTWTTPSPTGVTLTARARHKLVKDGNGFLIIGGLTTGGGGVTTIQRYDTVTNVASTVTGSFSAAIFGLADTGSGTVYASGGYVGSPSALMTAITTATGTTTARAAMSSTRYSHASFYTKLHVYLLGGTTGTAGDSTKVVRYRPETNLYETLGTIPYTVGENPATVQVGSSYYLFGGNGAAGAQAWKYTP